MHSPNEIRLSSLSIISSTEGNREATEAQNFESSAASSPGVKDPRTQPTKVDKFNSSSTHI